MTFRDSRTHFYFFPELIFQDRDWDGDSRKSLPESVVSIELGSHRDLKVWSRLNWDLIGT
jgi:hypothetical protein